MTDAGRKIQVAEHIAVEWLEEQTAEAVCPNCGAAGPVRQILATDYTPPGASHRFVLQVCPRCTVRFVDNMHTMDYATEELIELGWHSYQSQIGAGIWPISAPLTRINKPEGARVLEIGGAYGFGLDFCVQARGWRGEGFDPSPLAAFGARELGLDIRQDYFTERKLAEGPWDVIISTEVIEHLENPPEFLRLMRRAIADDGILVLTTPDAEWISPALAAADLISLISPDAHLILQTAESLRIALERAGFAHVAVVRESMTLIAYASPAPFTLNEDMAAGRAAYRRYLAGRAAWAKPGSDLQLGFAGRGLFEAANDADAPGVESAWATLRAGALQRFGYDLEDLSALPQGCETANLAKLAKQMPLGLGMILFGRAMHRLSQGGNRAQLRPVFKLVADAVAALQQALAQRSLGDGLSDNIADIVREELLLCAAEAGEQESVAGLVAGGNVIAGWRGFVALVNAGQFELAAALKDGLLGEMPGADIATGLRRDALLSLANFHLAPRSDAGRAFGYAEALRAEGETVDEILLGGFTRLVNASRYDEALDAAARYGIEALARQYGAQKSGHDARLARMVLDLAVGDPAKIPARLQDMEIEPERRDTLLLEAFIRLVNTSRYDEALAFIAAHDVPSRAARIGGDVARNTGLARMVLDLAVGDPAEIPARLQGMEIEPERRDTLLLEAFIRLVNASRYDEALAFMADHDVPGLSRALGGKTGGDAAIGLAVVELAVGDPACVAGHLAGPEVDGVRRDALLLGAFTGLVNTARYEEAEAMAAAQPCLQGLSTQQEQAGKDARMAMAMLDLQRGRTEMALQRLTELAQEGLDAALLSRLRLDAFVRLVNEGNFSAARALEQDDLVDRLDACTPALRQDALVALLLLGMQPGGDLGRIPERLDAALREGIDETRARALMLTAFATLVNNAAFATARQILPVVDPVLLKMRPPFAPEERDTLFAAGILFLQEKDDWRRGVASLARLRDELMKRTPPGETPDQLFWPALRGEVVALFNLGRAEEATALLTALIPTYPGAPDDLRHLIEKQEP
jgi:SAM-dependent methyltransferase